MNSLQEALQAAHVLLGARSRMLANLLTILEEVPSLLHLQRVRSFGARSACLALFMVLQIVEVGGHGSLAWAQTTPAFVEFEIKGRRYRVPEKYLDIPRSADQLGRVNRTQGQFGFAFWLSDGKPSQTRLLSLNTFWPKEPGRSLSGDDDFVVQVVSVTYVLPGEEAKEVLPSKKLHNSLTYLVPAPERTEDTVFGLLRYTLVRPGDHLVVAATPSGSDPDVLLMSSWIEKDWTGGRPPNPLWKTSVFSKADGLLIELWIPEIALRRWSDVVCQTLTLVRSWEVPPSQQRQGCTGPRIASSTKLGFHRASFPGMSAGVAPDFAQRVLDTPGDSIWVPTPEELLAARVIKRVNR